MPSLLPCEERSRRRRRSERNWTGAGLIGFYGYCAGRLAEATVPGALRQAVAVAVGLIGALLITFKALVH